MNSRAHSRITPAFLACGGSLFSLGKNHNSRTLLEQGNPRIHSRKPHASKPLTGAGVRDAKAVPFTPAPDQGACTKLPQRNDNMDREKIAKIIRDHSSPSTGFAIASAILHLADRVDNQTAEIAHAIDNGVKVLETQLANIAYLKHIDDLNVQEHAKVYPVRTEDH